jgi:hypothetical protein
MHPERQGLAQAGVALPDAAFLHSPGWVVPADDVVVALTNNLAVLDNHGAEAATCTEKQGENLPSATILHAVADRCAL